MNDDRRNPFLILGVPFGADREAATAAFAQRTRASRRDAEFPYTIDDLTWALHQVEEQLTDPALDLTTFRVPADPTALDPPPGPGVLRLAPEPLARRTNPATDEMITQLRSRALREEIAAAIERDAAHVAALYGFDAPTRTVTATVPARKPPPAPPRPPYDPTPAAHATAPPRRRPARNAAIVVLVAAVAVGVGFIAARASQDSRAIEASPPAGNDPDDASTGAEQPPTNTAATSPATTQPRVETPTTVRVTTTTALPTTTVPENPASGHPYFDALTRWTLDGTLQMQELAAFRSPAWAYGRHLEQSLRAGGGSLSTSFTPTSPDAGDFCIGSTCFAITDITLQGDELYTFNVNGTSLDDMSTAWTTDDAPIDCWHDGPYSGCPGANAVTMRLTTIYTVGETTWVSVEVDAGSLVTPDSGPRRARIRTFSGSLDSNSFFGSGPISQGGMTVWLFKFSGVTNPEITEFTVFLGWDGSEYDWTFSSL